MKILHVIQTLHGGGAEKIVMDLHSLSRAQMFEIKETGNKYIRLYEQLIYDQFTEGKV